jgi:hypothetical protein
MNADVLRDRVESDLISPMLTNTKVLLFGEEIVISESILIIGMESILY